MTPNSAQGRSFYGGKEVRGPPSKVVKTLFPPKENSSPGAAGVQKRVTAVKRAPSSLPKAKRQKRFVQKKAAAVTKLVLDHHEDRVTHLESRLADRTAQLAAEKARVAERDAENDRLKAEVNNLKRELQQLRETSHLESHRDILQEMRAGIGELQATLREQRSYSTPERPMPRCTSTPAPETSSLQMSPLALSITLNDSRYGCLLFRSIVTEEHYKAWSKTTNWDGAKGKRALPQNVKNFVVSTLQRKFPAMGRSELKDCINKINEFLRKHARSSQGFNVL
ncbi:hypothetical protein AALO_G00273480 [Alosa alosa]|uniref:BEN domain-containing protein n=1 Tax=Alosa alosa TaxID=278164 RepID=A0AAV6FII9_9TELE|nr:hypothetical protein AALO_G00273480 [Alosa alosa]